MTRDSVRIVNASGASETVALANVDLMDFSSGTHTPPWAALAGIVTVPVGATAGLMGAMATSVARERSIGTYFEQGFWIGAGAGLVAGVVIAKTHKTEDWSPVMLLPRSDRLVPESPRVVPDTPYRPRMRVKLRVAGKNVVGTLVEQRDDSIVLAWNSAHTSYPRASVTDVRVSRGKSAWTGAKFGALVGAGVGLARGTYEAAMPNDATNDLRDPNCEATMTPCRYQSDLVLVANYVAGAALLGAVAGAVIRRERWVKGALPAPDRDGDAAHLLLGPARNGVRVGVSVTF